MNEILTDKEIKKTVDLCLNNPKKACAFAQLIIDVCGVVSCNTYAEIKGKKVRTIQYQSDKLTGIEIDCRKFPSINQ